MRLHVAWNSFPHVRLYAHVQLELKLQGRHGAATLQRFGTGTWDHADIIPAPRTQAAAQHGR